MNDRTSRSRQRLPDLNRLRSSPVLWALLACLAAAVIGLGGPTWLSSPASSPKPLDLSAAGPRPPAARVCGNDAILGAGPSSAPRRAVTVPAGDNSGVSWGQTSTTYWFAPGTHTFGRGQYSQIVPGSGSTYIGAPGAVLDGRNTNDTAFGGDAADVTIEHLTIENFAARGDQGAVNASAAPGWRIEYNTIRDIVPGTAIYVGAHNVIKFNCLTRNGQSAFGTYTTHRTSSLTNGASDVVVSNNEISYNDTCNWEALPKFPGPAPPAGCSGAGQYSGCGCSGGGKFWHTDGGEFDDNFVHGNYGVGVWWDANNTGFEIEGNYISSNYADGLIYEISYNALIKNNTFVRNGLVAGPATRGFPTGAIYVSESGSDSRVPGKYGRTFAITRNTFIDNWGGVILWENSNRFCDSPANTSSGDCTLVDPAVATVRSCDASNIAHPPYYSDCRWKTQNVLVYRNVFDFNPANIGPACTPANDCGFQGLFSEYGSYPSWSPYKGTVVENHVTFDQNNHFSSNVYNGPWQFMVQGQDNAVNWEIWRGSPYRQDRGSAMTSAGM